jgi:thioredoxin reductase
VVGAGPYGLSVAAHLRGRHAAHVFGDPMGGWIQNMPTGMFLKSERDASNLSAPAPGHTLADYYAAAGIPFQSRDDPVPIAVFIAYGLWFQEQFVPEIDRARVRRIDSGKAGFELALDSGETLRARRVVVATGLAEYAYVPDELASLAPGGPAADGPVSHTSQHADLSGFSGRRVAVIGAGQSALESAALLHEAGAEVHVLVRADHVRWGVRQGASWKLRTKPSSGLGPGWSLFAADRAPGLIHRLPDSSRLYLVRTILGPSGAWWLRDRVVDQVEIRTACQIVHAELDNGAVVIRYSTPSGASEELAVDHVLAATGYRVDLDQTAILSDAVRTQLRRIGSSPRLSKRFESSVPGLFFTGLAAAASFGPVLRFVRGADFTARCVSASSGS